MQFMKYDFQIADPVAEAKFCAWLQRETAVAFQRSHDDPNALEANVSLFADRALAAHMPEEQYNQLFDKCLDEAGFDTEDGDAAIETLQVKIAAISEDAATDPDFPLSRETRLTIGVLFLSVATCWWWMLISTGEKLPLKQWSLMAPLCFLALLAYPCFFRTGRGIALRLIGSIFCLGIFWQMAIYLSFPPSPMGCVLALAVAIPLLPNGAYVAFTGRFPKRNPIASFFYPKLHSDRG
jgi:hypothetical protein